MWEHWLLLKNKHAFKFKWEILFSFSCQNPNTTSTQLNNLSWGWHKNDFTPPPPNTHRTNSMLVISQLLLTRSWPNFKVRFLGLSWTDSGCHSDICPGNICTCSICPYQECLSCYWPNFDPNVLKQYFFLTQTFWTYNFLNQKSFWIKILWDQKSLINFVFHGV